MAKIKLLIFPYNGNGLEALDCLGDQFEFIGFIDDTPEKQGVTKYGHKVFSREILAELPEAKVLAVPGSPTSYKIRNEIISNLKLPVDRFTTIIHPKASVSALASVGHNSLIMAGVVITSNAIIGSHVCILPNSVIHHDCVIGNYTLLGSSVSIAGSTIVGNNCYIGSGTKIINNVSIGDHTLIGLGSNVIKSVEANSKVVGNPAKSI
jgi:sugar O-acyltransferase (sialic acid O-acetyltransferase NeuD family)